MPLVKHSKRTVRKPCRYCRSKDLYWAHDTAVSGDHCRQCDVSGRWLLVELDGETPHSLKCSRSAGSSPSETDAESPAAPSGAPTPSVVDPAPERAPETAPDVSTTPGTTDAFAAFQALMASMAPKVDRADVELMIKDALNDAVFPTRTVVERASGETVKIDGSHEKLADVTTDLLAGEHVMMVGPAGTGKSTIAQQAAESLKLAYYSISLSPMTPASQILGYMQAAGEYVRSLFREAYETGGVFHFDEFDNGHPSVLAVINAALSNGSMAFPDTMVKRHPDFRCVASANTYGKGADRQYVGRQQIDAATLDRFCVETVNVDEALETELCHGTGAKQVTVTDVLTYVRRLRSNAESKGMTVVVSPRASVGMCRLLNAGKSWDAAVAARVRKGMSDQDWLKLTG